MTRTLDVLVIESRRGAGRRADEALAAAGHRVHRCYEHGTDEFPCRGLLEPDACPLDDGVDVALLVRPRIDPRPTPRESGVTCALRAQVPLVEVGDHPLDPYEPWVAARVADAHDHDAMVAACTGAVEDRLGEKSRHLVERLDPLLASLGVAPEQVECRVEFRDHRAVISLMLPAHVDDQARHALAVRAVDVLRSSGAAARTTDVTLHTSG
jgi:hypothetical protein